MMRLVLHIDRLVLSGFDSGQRFAIAEGLRAELARQLGSSHAARPWRGQPDIAEMNVGAVPVAASAAPATIGVQAAKGIARGLVR